MSEVEQQTSIFDFVPDSWSFWAEVDGLPESCRKAVEFHMDHPHFYRLFRRFANEAVGAGAENFGAAAVAERMRWYSMIERPDGEEYKINNNLRALYARLFDFERRGRGEEGFFRSRESGFDNLSARALRLMVESQ